MKKFSVLFAVTALVLASLACQTIMGGGNDFEVPDVPQTDSSDEEIPTTAPETTENDGNITVGGESPFPVTSDAFNVVSTPDALTFQTNLSADDVVEFYREELAEQGFTEDEDLTTNFSGIVAMFFEGNGKTIVLAGAPAGDGSLLVTLAYQQ